MLDVASGKIVVAMTNMNASGEVYTFKTGDEARIEVFNGRFNNMKKTLASAADAPRVGVATSEDGVIEVYTLTGTLVHSGPAPRLDIYPLPSGVYIAVARSAKSRHVLKFAR